MIECLIPASTISVHNVIQICSYFLSIYIILCIYLYLILCTNTSISSQHLPTQNISFGENKYINI